MEVLPITGHLEEHADIEICVTSSKLDFIHFEREVLVVVVVNECWQGRVS